MSLPIQAVLWSYEFKIGKNHKQTNRQEKQNKNQINKNSKPTPATGLGFTGKRKSSQPNSTQVIHVIQKGLEPLSFYDQVK